MPEKGKISVIVPVYNVKSYLPQCIDSILQQTYDRLEILCIDDGSTDGCGELLDGYAALHRNLKVLHVPNAGYGAAINRGLDAASGEYIGIVESDDWILPQMYASLYEAAAEHDFPDVVKADAVFCWDSYGYRYRWHRADLEEDYGRVLRKPDFRKRLEFFMNIWTGIYRREFLEQYGIRCHETPGASYQDNGFWFQTMTFADSVLFVDNAWYMYRQDNAGSSFRSAGKPLAMAGEYTWLEGELTQKDAGQEALDRCHYFRLVRNYGSWLRTSSEYKDALLPVMLSDYEKYQDTVPAEGFVHDEYQLFLKDPAGLTLAQKHFRERTFRQWDSAERIVIYGAGTHSEQMLRMLLNYGCGDRVLGFAVTDAAGQRDHIGEYPVVALKELAGKIDFATTAFVLSVFVRSRYYAEMTAQLRALDVPEWTNADEMFRYLYLIS